MAFFDTYHSKELLRMYSCILHTFCTAGERCTGIGGLVCAKLFKILIVILFMFNANDMLTQRKTPMGCLVSMANHHTNTRTLCETLKLYSDYPMQCLFPYTDRETTKTTATTPKYIETRRTMEIWDTQSLSSIFFIFKKKHTFPSLILGHKAHTHNLKHTYDTTNSLSYILYALDM